MLCMLHFKKGSLDKKSSCSQYCSSRQVDLPIKKSPWKRVIIGEFFFLEVGVCFSVLREGYAVRL